MSGLAGLKGPGWTSELPSVLGSRWKGEQDIMHVLDANQVSARAGQEGAGVQGSPREPAWSLIPMAE